MNWDSFPLYNKDKPIKGIENQPGWQGDISFGEIRTLLMNSPPRSYILSEARDGCFLLSFIRLDGESIMFVECDQTRDGRWRFSHDVEITSPYLKEFVRKMMNLTDSMPDPIPVPPNGGSE